MGNTKLPGVIGVHDHTEQTCRLPRPGDFLNPWGLTFIYPDTNTEGTGYRAKQSTGFSGPCGLTAPSFNVINMSTESACRVLKEDDSGSYQKEDGTENLKVSKGQLTFDAEGNDKPGSIYFSRKPHVPTASSGLTIGRGYDMKEKSAKKIKDDLTSVGISEALADKLSKAAGKKGADAEKIIADNKLTDTVITRQQQKELFKISYSELEKDVERICSKADVVKAYGKTDWLKLNPKIGDVLIDLRFRGDYTPSSRKLLQKYVADNDLKKFKEVICKQANWSSVPKDRFNRRCNYMK